MKNKYYTTEYTYDSYWTQDGKILFNGLKELKNDRL
jgi:hypothetical protein